MDKVRIFSQTFKIEILFDSIMIITDDHAHLEMDVYGDLDDFVNDQKDNDVKYIITQGIDLSSSKKALELSKKYDIVLAALGIYPPDTLAKDLETDSEVLGTNSKPEDLMSKDKLKDALKWIEKNLGKAVAVGEVGMDFKDANADKELQEWLFRKFIEMAIKYNKPIIIHSRKAEERVLEILGEYDYKKIVLHCFSGKKRLIQLAKERKYYFSVPTNIVNSEHFKMLVSMVDMSRILTETDAPYLSPFKDWPNKPKNIIESLKTIADLKGMTVEETALAVFQNFQKLYL